MTDCCACGLGEAQGRARQLLNAAGEAIGAEAADDSKTIRHSPAKKMPGIFDLEVLVPPEKGAT
jgi:hypothetical protein